MNYYGDNKEIKSAILKEKLHWLFDKTKLELLEHIEHNQSNQRTESYKDEHYGSANIKVYLNSNLLHDVEIKENEHYVSIKDVFELAKQLKFMYTDFGTVKTAVEFTEIMPE